MDSRDVAAFLSMASFWALNYPLVKFALIYEPPLFILVFRVLFAAIFSVIFLSRNFSIPKDLKTHLSIAVVGLLNVVMFMGFWFTGELTEPSSISSIIVYTYPIFAMAFSTAFLGERPSRYKIAGTVVGFAGIVFVFADQLYIKPGIGLVFLISGAISWAVGTIYFKRHLSSANVLSVNALQFVYALPIILVWAFMMQPFRISGFTPQFFVITLFMGSLGSAVAYYIYFHLFRKYDVSSISSFFFIVPALSIVFAYLILGETNTIFTYIGFALISLGIYLTSRSSRRSG
ncbi:hypothetical protein IX51_01330 [uncultured archaeon]|nr:hypothetical protein IX51_01330 [uncultured archaeon]